MEQLRVPAVKSFFNNLHDISKWSCGVCSTFLEFKPLVETIRLLNCNLYSQVHRGWNSRAFPLLSARLRVSTSSVNTVSCSGPRSEHECNHYQNMLCWRENAEMFKAKTVGTALSVLSACLLCISIHSTVSIALCVCVCMYISALHAVALLLLVCVLWKEEATWVVCLAYQWRPGPRWLLQKHSELSSSCLLASAPHI